MYTISTTASVSLAEDLWDVAPAADKPCVLHAVFVNNIGGAADAGDAQEELLQVGLLVGAASNGGGSTTTPFSIKRAMTQAAGFTARMFSTITTATGSSVAHVEGWNVRVPYVMLPTPEMRHDWSSANGLRMVFRLMTAPADALSIGVTAYIEEL